MQNFSNTPIVELAAIVADHLKQRGITVVLVGGLAVEIYSENLYLTKDIDLIDISYQEPAVLSQAMAEIGFSKQGRVYVNETTEICVEFPSAPLSIGEQLITETTVFESNAGEIPILFAKDVIKDRLAAYFHWQDKQSLVQAVAVMIKHPISLDELKSFCQNESKENEFALIQQLLHSAKQQELSEMADIEKLVVSEILRRL
jgi:hypothetical protein